MWKQAKCLAAFAALLTLPAPGAHSYGLGDLAGKAKDVVKTAPPVQSSKDAKDSKDAKISSDANIVLPPYTGPKKRLGVMDVDVKVSATTTTQPTATGGIASTTTISIPAPTDFGSGLTEMLTTALVNSKRFVLLERKALADIQAEQALGTIGATSADSKAETGKLLGAQALIRGAVTEYTYTQSSSGGNVNALQGVGLSASKAEAAVTLDVRLYDATTGVIIDSVKAEGRARSSGAAVDVNRQEFKMSAATFSQTPLGHATRQAIDRAVVFICERMDKIPWEGRIADIDADASGNINDIYLNAGSEMGLKEGDELEVLRAGRAIIDPETKTVIGRTKDTLLGKCKISTIQKNFSIAALTEGQGAKAGDVVRFPGTGLKANEPAPVPTTPAEASQPAAGSAPGGQGTN